MAKRRRRYPWDPKKREERTLHRMSEKEEIICRMADASSGDDAPFPDNDLGLKEILEVEEMPEGVLGLYRIFHSFTDGNAMVRGENREILNSFPATTNHRKGESTVAKQYIRSGFDYANQNGPGRNRDFSAKEPDRDGNILVVMTEGEFTHKFVVTAEAIRDFFAEHPIRGRFVIPEVIKTIRRKIVDFSCAPIPEQLILRNRCKETITHVEKIASGGFWTFHCSFDDDGDVLNRNEADRIRFIAFMEAFRKATCDGTRGGYYEWMYKAICFPDHPAA